MSPAEVQLSPPEQMRERARGLWSRYKWFAIFVLAPTLISALYLYAVAANQYISEAHFVVRSASASTSSSSSGSSGLGSLLGGGGGSSVASAGDSMTVADYLGSHDAIDSLNRRVDLVAMFRRPEADLLSRLNIEKPTPEFLKKYYDSQVEVYFNTDNGITSLTSRAFRPGDAYAITSQLLQLGERRVNEMNVRAYNDAVSLSKRQLDESERALRSIGKNVTSFRQSERDVDPSTTASAQIGLVSRLEGELAAARAQLATTQQLIGGTNPQGEALRKQVQALQREIASEKARLAGNNSAIASNLGTFEDLTTQRTFLQSRYATASSAFDAARQSALRQQLYIVRVVNPNMPVKSLYPQRALTVFTIFAVLLIVYAIGWLIAAGVREHSV